MFNHLQVNKFKSLDLKKEIKLNSLNVFCGANSSGKSTFLQAILMLAQTANARHGGSTMTLNGKLVKLGGFDDIISFGKDNELVRLQTEIQGDPKNDGDIELVNLIVEFGFDNELIELHREQITPPIKKIKYNIQVKGNESPLIVELKSLMDGNRFEVEKIINDELITIKRKHPDVVVSEFILDGLIPLHCNVKYNKSKLLVRDSIDFLCSPRLHRRYVKIPEGVISYDEIPKNLLEVIYSIVLREQEHITKRVKKSFQETLLKLELPDEYLKENILKALLKDRLTIDSDSFSKLLEEAPKKTTWAKYISTLDKEQQRNIINVISRNREEIVSKVVSKSEIIFESDIYMPSLFLELSSFINENLSLGVKYIGPIRSKPKSVYPLTDITNRTDLGVKGEHSAAILHTNKNSIITYPYVESDNNNGLLLSKKRGLFIDALHHWLKYLDIVQSVSTKDQGKFGYELKVKTTKAQAPQDLNHVGVGVSQVIPVVMQCLLSSENDILVFEQPELHLHPKIQCKLCDLFIAISQFNRQIVIETHSEYMINRLRYRIAQDISNELSEKVSIKFARKEDEVTVFEDIEVSRFGAIKNWPIDFFDQTQNEVEKILTSASKKRKLERRR